MHADACLLCVSTASSGHSQQQGDYHYHFPPSCLVAQATAQSPTSGDVAGHSPQIGWAFDGFPVYGPLYTGGQKVSGLDECGGKQEELAALDKFKYRYYFVGDMSNLYALPGHPKPAGTDYLLAFKCQKVRSCSPESGRERANEGATARAGVCPSCNSPSRAICARTCTRKHLSLFIESLHPQPVLCHVTSALVIRTSLPQSP